MGGEGCEHSREKGGKARDQYGNNRFNSNACKVTCEVKISRAGALKGCDERIKEVTQQEGGAAELDVPRSLT